MRRPSTPLIAATKGQRNTVVATSADLEMDTVALQASDDGPPESGATTRARAYTQTPLRILIVEDDDDTRIVTGALIQSTGAHTLILAATAERGLDHLREQSFDLLITDIGLPGISGLEMLDQAEREGLLPPATSVVVCSALHACPRTSVPFVRKPASADALCQIVGARFSRDDRAPEIT